MTKIKRIAEGYQMGTTRIIKVAEGWELEGEPVDLNVDKVDGKHASDLCGVFNWKDAPGILIGGTDYTIDGNWTVLSLQSKTSINAKFAFLLIRIDYQGNAGDKIRVRRVGQAVYFAISLETEMGNSDLYEFGIVKLNANQEIEYWATDASDTKIFVLGYVE